MDLTDIVLRFILHFYSILAFIYLLLFLFTYSIPSIVDKQALDDQSSFAFSKPVTLKKDGE